MKPPEKWNKHIQPRNQACRTCPEREPLQLSHNSARLTTTLGENKHHLKRDESPKNNMDTVQGMNIEILPPEETPNTMANSSQTTAQSKSKSTIASNSHGHLRKPQTRVDDIKMPIEGQAKALRYKSDTILLLLLRYLDDDRGNDKVTPYSAKKNVEDDYTR